MDPTQLREFERRPAFGIYPPGEEDPLPPQIQKIRDKWARHRLKKGKSEIRVNLGAIWTVIRVGYNFYEENYVIDPSTPYQLSPLHRVRVDYNRQFLASLSPYMRALIKKIRNDKRTKEEKDQDRQVLKDHCRESAVKVFEFFCERVRSKDPPLDWVPLPDPRKRERRRPTEFVGPVTYLIASILKQAGMLSKKGSRADRFYWKEIGELLSFYYPWETHLTNNDLRGFYNHHCKVGIPSDWPKPQILLGEPRKHSLS